MFKLTNTHVPEKTITAVEKIWDDAENEDGARPDSVTMMLYVNNEATGIEVILAESELRRMVDSTNLPQLRRPVAEALEKAGEREN